MWKTSIKLKNGGALLKRLPNSYHLRTIHEIDFKGDDSLVKVEAAN